jgi:hypothetical protein
MSAAARTYLGAVLFVVWSAPVFADSAYDQLLQQAGGAAPSVPEVSAPRCVGNCGSVPRASAPRTPTTHTYGYNPAVDIGATIFGSILESVLFAPEPQSGPDPATLRRQEEARKQAEAEAKRRAAEEEARHRRLMASLKSMPLPEHYTAVPGAQGTTEIKLKSLSALEGVQGPQPGAGSNEPEQLRADASLGWDTAAAVDTRFAIRFQPMPVSGAPLQPVYHAFCHNKSCNWPTETGATLPAVTAQKGVTQVPRRDEIVNLLRQSSMKSGYIGAAVISGIMADAPPAQGRYILDERLNRFSVSAGKELAKEWFWLLTARLLENERTLQQGIDLTHKVYELGSQDMSDAVKAANWLGSSQTDGLPEITTVPDASLPFLQSALDATTVFGESATQLVYAGIETHGLASNLKSLWEGGE